MNFAEKVRQPGKEVSGCFAGGELSEEDKDEMMKAIQDACWMAKKNNQKLPPAR